MSYVLALVNSCIRYAMHCSAFPTENQAIVYTTYVYLYVSHNFRLPTCTRYSDTCKWTYRCTHLALHVRVSCQQYVPCSKVSVDETLLGEVVHSISYLPTEGQQLNLQLPNIKRPNYTKANTKSTQRLWHFYQQNHFDYVRFCEPNLPHSFHFQEMTSEITS